MSEQELMVGSRRTAAVVRGYSRALTLEGAGAMKEFLRLPSGATGGKWRIGEDEEEVLDGTKVVVDPLSFEWGWEVWRANKPVLTTLAPCTEEMPAEPTMVEGEPLKKGDKVQATYRLSVRFASGCVATIKGGTKGLEFALMKLMHKMYFRGEAGETALVPVVELRSDFYIHPENGKIFKPVFKVVGWLES